MDSGAAYRTLGVEPGSDPKTVSRAYRKKAIFGEARLESVGDRFGDNGRQSSAAGESTIDVTEPKAVADPARVLDAYPEGAGDWPWGKRSP